MKKLTIKEKRAILENKFPEFRKLSDDMKAELDVLISELEDRLEQLENLQDKIDEVEELKSGIEF